jgi:hypothetical protein
MDIKLQTWVQALMQCISHRVPDSSPVAARTRSFQEARVAEAPPHTHAEQLARTVAPPNDRKDLHSNKPRLQRLLQEYPLLALSPVNVVGQDGDLDFLGFRNGVEEVEQSADCTLGGQA